ncbi:ABC transporter ATP-binding protein/permease [Rothia sp. AR01]|uniref:ABC transporter ATP-binding protein/permease n=1 Tax=Rothia santali TaxID=2949643 RepID=A0A9X2HCX6_9MICC|nr:ABC transporter ATP-binding protein/permease [Rothia santali]
MGWVRRLVGICCEFPKLVALIMVVSVATIAAVVAGPLLTREGINGAVAGQTSSLWWLGGGLVAIAAFDFLGDYLRRFAAGKLSLRVQHAMRSRVFDSIQRLDGPGQDSLRTGQVVSRTNNDLQQVQAMLQMCPVPLSVISYYAFGLAVMLWLSPSLTLISVSVIALLGLTAWRTRKRVFRTSAQAQQDVGEVTEHIRSTLAGISVVKSTVQEARHARWIERASRSLFSRRMQTMRAQAAPGATMLALPPLGQAALLLVGGWQVMTGRLDLGTFVAFSTYLSMLTGPTRVLASFLVIAQRTRTCAERIFELMDARPEMRDGTASAPAGAGLELRGVSFGYTSDDPVLRDVGFRVEPGETVAVVGASGSGKSTLALLVPRFYDVAGGQVLIGAPDAPGGPVDVRELRLEELRRSVSVVFEDPFLFRATVRENIAYGNPGCDDAAVEAAARAAGAEEFIARLERGYETPLAEGGRNLSGGQRQRLALARALLSEPGVLIVDDATSAVDAATESGINRALRGYARPGGPDGAPGSEGSRCTLLIARRRSTLDLADRIVVLHEGRTVGVGTREELLRDCPEFAELMAGGQEAIDEVSGASRLWPEKTAGAAGVVGAAEEGPEHPETAPARRGASSRPRRLTAVPRAAVTMAQDPRVTKVTQMLRPVKGPFSAALLLIALSALVGVLVPVMVQRGIDHGVGPGDGHVLMLCAGLAGALVFADWFFYAGQTLLSSRGSEAVQYGVRVRSFRHVLGFGLPYFEGQQGGQMLTRLTVDVDSLARFLQTGLVNGAMSLITMFGIGVAMVVFDPLLALVALSPLPVVVAATLVFRRFSSRAYSKAREDIGKVNSSLQENISGLRVVQSHGKQGAAARLFQRVSDRYRISREKAQRYIALYFPFVVFCSQLSNALVLVAGAHFVARGSLTAGVLAAFLLFLGQFYAPIQQLANIIDSYQQARIGQKRTDELLAMPREEGDLVDAAPVQDGPSLRGDVSLLDVDYTHAGAPAPALRGLGLELPAGTSLAVVGSTGAGKTTLVKVMAWLYDADAGAVEVGGAERGGLERGAYRRRVGLVSQEPYLFATTVAENIRYARPEASDAEVQEAARRAGALPAVSRLPGGFEHEVEDGGGNLAAGHRQLIALARAELAGIDLLLLDEATAQLDPASEQAVMDAVRDAGTTAVVVAHRLSTAARCDRIAVLERGEVVETGTHAELLELGGRYARLHGSLDPGAPAPSDAHPVGTH